MLNAPHLMEAAVRSPLALLPSLLVVAACHPTSVSDTPFLGNNRVNIDVRCNTTEVTVTVNPWSATAATNEPMEWHIVPNAHVAEVRITAKDTSKWPFTEPLPYSATPSRPAQAKGRAPAWPLGSKAFYTISGTCKNGSGPDRPFVIDPDMIVF